MNYFVKLMDILLYDEIIPYYYKADIAKRLNDWCGAGGKTTDEYVKRQCEYLLRVREMIKNRETGKC